MLLLIKEDEIPPFWQENYYMTNGEKWLEKLNSRLARLESGEQAPENGNTVYSRFKE